MVSTLFQKENNQRIARRKRQKYISLVFLFGLCQRGGSTVETTLDLTTSYKIVAVINRQRTSRSVVKHVQQHTAYKPHNFGAVVTVKKEMTFYFRGFIRSPL